MMISAKVRKYIANLPEEQPFATRELLGFGPRGAIDKLLSRLVEASLLYRVARGIFIKFNADADGRPFLPTLAQIVKTKAQAFAKQIFTHGKDAAHAFQMLVSESGELAEPNAAPTFVASGSSTSFLCESSDFGLARVHFRSSSPLSKKFLDDKSGLFFRAMRNIQLSAMSKPPHEENFCRTHMLFNKKERAAAKEASKWMPTWLSRMFWMKPPALDDLKQSNSWDFLKKYMTDAQVAEYLKNNISPVQKPRSSGNSDDPLTLKQTNFGDLSHF